MSNNPFLNNPFEKQAKEDLADAKRWRVVQIVVGTILLFILCLVFCC